MHKIQFTKDALFDIEATALWYEEKNRDWDFHMILNYVLKQD